MSDAAHGNDAVVAALETALARAREGRIGYIALLVLEDGKPAQSIVTGSISLLDSACDAIDAVADRMKVALFNRTLPPPDPALGADYVSYNMTSAPVSFDFMSWLVDAEMYRVREGAPAPLKVHFWFGRDGRHELTPPGRQFFENVMRPLISLIGAVETGMIGGRSKPFYQFRDVVGMARAGVPVPKIKVPTSIGQSGYVTITLREAEHWPHRNSDLDVWLRFAAWLRARGEEVCFVREPAFAGQELPGGWPQNETAPFNLERRAVLYDRAKINLFVMNGPFSLALFMDRPFLAFNETPREDDPYWPNRPSFWREFAGLEPGDQHPWLRADQRMIWQKPTFDLLVEAWRAAESALPPLRRRA